MYIAATCGSVSQLCAVCGAVQSFQPMPNSARINHWTGRWKLFQGTILLAKVPKIKVAINLAFRQSLFTPPFEETLFKKYFHLCAIVSIPKLQRMKPSNLKLKIIPRVGVFVDSGHIAVYGNHYPKTGFHIHSHPGDPPHAVI